jgi:hypothetical protein
LIEASGGEMNLINNRTQSLTQRANSLIGELEAWLNYVEMNGQLEKNYSQLEAIQLFMGQLFQRIDELKIQLSQVAITKDQLQVLFVLERGIYRTNYIWDYFRTKLEQRFNPQFSQALLVSDLVAYDCYNRIRRNADNLEIQHKLGLRDYPLTFLQEQYGSPVTWMRNARLRELGNLMLPVPMIGIPHDHVNSPWELLSIHHEVSHDIDADLGVASDELGQRLQEILLTKGTPFKRANLWQMWISEIFADFMGIMLGGVPFVAFLATYLALPDTQVYQLNDNDPHPVHYLRTLLNCEFASRREQNSSGQEYAQKIAAAWRDIYTNPSSELKAFKNDFNFVIDSFINTPLDCLTDKQNKPHSLGELIAPEPTFDDQVGNANAYLSGQNLASGAPIRHLISACQLAFGRLRDIPECNAKILAERVTHSVIEAAPPGKLGLRSKKSKIHIQSLADEFWKTMDEIME